MYGITFFRSDDAIASIRTNDSWQDVDIISGNDSTYSKLQNPDWVQKTEMKGISSYESEIILWHG